LVIVVTIENDAAQCAAEHRYRKPLTPVPAERHQVKRHQVERRRAAGVTQ
jgi:hypothetical protein